VIALGGVGTAQMVSIALEDQRTQEARDLEGQRAREAALQNYFEQVGTLLIEQPLRRAGPGDNLSTGVRAQTLSVLAGLDPDRKRILLQFLYESGLIYKDEPVISLAAATLSGVNLNTENLTRVVWVGAHRFGANLRGADLRWAALREANLREADLSRAQMDGATGVTSQRLEQLAKSLEGAGMPDGSTHR
jgi:uncharacterized protein YjbI with pentapeptide repeats